MTPLRRITLILTIMNLFVVGWSAYNGYRVHRENLITFRKIDEMNKLSAQAIKKAKEAKATCENIRGILPERDL